MFLPINKAIPNRTPFWISDKPVKCRPLIDPRIKAPAINKIAEIALALTVNLLLAHATLSLSISASVLLLATPILAKVSDATAQWLQAKKSNSDTDPLDWGCKCAKYSYANVFMAAGPSIVVHEMGHAIASRLLYKNAQPLISIQPFKGGSTSYITSYGLTTLGERLGKSTSKLIICASGMAASTLFAAGSFILAGRIKDSHPHASRWLEWQGISQLAQDVLYGLSAFTISQTKMSHDFVYLWVKGGINPLVPIAMMIALPVLSLRLFPGSGRDQHF